MTRSRDSGARAILRFVWTHPANRDRRIRALFRAAAFQLRARLLRKPVLARFGRRSRIWAVLDMSSSKRALYANPPDWPEMLVWRRRIAAGDLFVDVGANIGLYSILAIEQGARVIAIEPDAVAAQHLRRNLDLNGYDAEIYETALADKPGTSSFTVDHGVANKLVLDPTSPISRVPTRIREVPVETLDEILKGRTAAGVKVDVEGAELLVLKGAEKALAENRLGLLQLEFNACSVSLLGEDRGPLVEFLQRFGYELYVAGSDGSLEHVKTEDIHPEMYRGDIFAQRQ